MARKSFMHSIHGLLMGVVFICCLPSRVIATRQLHQNSKGTPVIAYRPGFSVTLAAPPTEIQAPPGTRERGENCMEYGRADSSLCQEGLTCLRRGWTRGRESSPDPLGQPYGCKDSHCCTPVEEVRQAVDNAMFSCSELTSTQLNHGAFLDGQNRFPFAEDARDVFDQPFASTRCDQLVGELPLGFCCFTGFTPGGCPPQLDEVQTLDSESNPVKFEGTDIPLYDINLRYLFNYYNSEICGRFRYY